MTYRLAPETVVQRVPVYVKVNGAEVEIGECHIAVSVEIEGFSQGAANNYLIGKISVKED